VERRALASALLQDETSPEDITTATVITPQEVKDIRARLGMTYRQLAIALGLTGRRALNTVYRWERGLKVPSPASIEGLRQLRANTQDRPDVTGLSGADGEPRQHEYDAAL
jgi:DNA-binding transcriptional regulator YiaG